MPREKDRNCPLCGSETTVETETGNITTYGRHFRKCTSDACNWCVDWYEFTA